MKKIISTMLSLAITSTSTLLILADEISYYNATAEFEQVNSQIRYGDYLGAIKNCEQTIAWHTLSPDDVNIFTELKTKASQRYNDYLNGTLYFYNAYDDIKLIERNITYYVNSSDIKFIEELLKKDLSPEDVIKVENLYYKAICRYTNNCYDASSELKACISNLKSGRFTNAANICTTILSRNDISGEDENKFSILLERAQGDIKSSWSGRNRISSNRASQIIQSLYTSYQINYFKYSFNVLDLGDCYVVLAKVNRNADGTSYYMVFDDGSYKYVSSGSDISLNGLGLI